MPGEGGTQQNSPHKTPVQAQSLMHDLVSSITSHTHTILDNIFFFFWTMLFFFSISLKKKKCTSPFSRKQSVLLHVMVQMEGGGKHEKHGAEEGDEDWTGANVW